MSSDNSSVAVVTENSPNLSGLMVMVNAQSNLEDFMVSFTYKATPILLLKHLIVLFFRYTVFLK